jgi:hypothetical protein
VDLNPLSHEGTSERRSGDQQGIGAHIAQERERGLGLGRDLPERPWDAIDLVDSGGQLGVLVDERRDSLVEGDAITAALSCQSGDTRSSTLCDVVVAQVLGQGALQSVCEDGLVV